MQVFAVGDKQIDTNIFGWYPRIQLQRLLNVEANQVFSGVDREQWSDRPQYKGSSAVYNVTEITPRLKCPDGNQGVSETIGFVAPQRNPIVQMECVSCQPSDANAAPTCQLQRILWSLLSPISARSFQTRERTSDWRSLYHRYSHFSTSLWIDSAHSYNAGCREYWMALSACRGWFMRALCLPRSRSA